MALKPNNVYFANGVEVNEYIIPDSYRWKSSSKASKAGFKAGSLYKANLKLSRGSGKVEGVTIHNTEDLKNVLEDGEQYTRATYPNENMNSVRVHFYVDEVSAWQNLKAGTGMCENDPEGSAEVGWHAGDGTYGEGNNTTIAIECIMNGSSGGDNTKAEDNAARLAAWLLVKHGLGVNRLYSHTYWINKESGFTGTLDYQNTHKTGVTKKNPNGKYCPVYILPHWSKFKEKVSKYVKELKENTPVKEEGKKENTPVKEEGEKENTPVKESVNINKNNKLAEGDWVDFKGGKQYLSSNASSGTNAKACKAKITRVYKKGKHPYHIRAINSFGKFISGVYGWVDASSVSGSSSGLTELKVGSKVKIKDSASTYYLGGTKIPSWVKDYYHTIKQVKSAKGLTVTKGGTVVVLLGNKIDKKTGKSSSGINSWIAIENLEILN